MTEERKAPQPAPQPAPQTALDKAVEGAVASVLEGQDKIKPSIGSDIFSVALMLGGAWMLLWGLDLVRPAGSEMHPMVALGGVIVATIGVLGFALGRKWATEEMLRAAYSVIVGGIFLILNVAAFSAGYEILSHNSIGKLSGPELARLAAIAVDLYLVSALGLLIARQLRKAPLRSRYRIARIAACVLVALGLQFTGALERIYDRFDILPPGPPLGIGALEPNLRSAGATEIPLADYAGTWTARRKGVQPKRPTGWVARIEIRIERNKANARLWRSCGQPLPCEVAGVFTAQVQRQSRGHAQTLHFAGSTDGMDWLVTITPLPDGGLMLGERHIQGRDQQTHQIANDRLNRE